jgi:hypothetical protein
MQHALGTTLARIRSRSARFNCFLQLSSHQHACAIEDQQHAVGVIIVIVVYIFFFLLAVCCVSRQMIGLVQSEIMAGSRYSYLNNY